MNYHLKFTTENGTELFSSFDEYLHALDAFKSSRESGLYVALTLWTPRGQVLQHWAAN